MFSNLSWAENCRKRISKGWRSFYALKRNIAHIANLPTKLYAFIDYVVPVLTYASQVVPLQTRIQGTRVQKTATKCICSSRDGYRIRLTRRNILSMYMELHALLFLLSVIYRKYNINRSTIPNFKSTDTRQSKEFEVPKQTEKMRRKFLDPSNETIQHSDKND